MNIEDRFFAKVKKTSACWIWTGSTSGSKGYGKFSVTSGPYDRTMVRAHRFSWVLHRGLIPKGQNVLHRCDNPLCVNPDHLFLGTQRTNLQDMIQKDRHRNRYSIIHRGRVESPPSV